MNLIADLHIHGRYARATSKNLTFQKLAEYAKIKGVNVLGTGDFTHPEWRKEIGLLKEKEGVLYDENNFPFLLQTEISLVYTQGGKGRRVHHLLLAPSLEVADQITEFLKTKGRVDYDGRPIFGMSSIECVEQLQSISKDIEMIPAHIWTPWFGMLGSKSGFDSLRECFEEKTHLIHAIETGMSSDPAMNWRIKELDSITLLSNSDLHSFWPWRLGREANVFSLKKLTYKEVLRAIRTREGLKSTIEVDPGYGKYHYDGHRTCQVCLSPEQSQQQNNLCKVCSKPLTLGVEHRIEALATREQGYTPKNAVPFKTLLPLTELISAVQKRPLASKKTWEVYNKAIQHFGNEYELLLHTEQSVLTKVLGEELTQIIMKNRENKLVVAPGYDGEYGKLQW